MRTIPLLFCAVVFIAAGSAFGLRAAEYEVSGVIEQTWFTREGSARTTTRTTFTVYVRDCAWLIHSLREEPGHAHLPRETSCTNGVDVYDAVLYSGQAVSSGQSADTRRAFTAVMVASNGVPTDMNANDDTPHLWLMFASGCYFANLSTNWITPVYDPSVVPGLMQDAKREAKWNLISGKGSLPMDVTFLGPYSLPRSPPPGFTGRLIPQPPQTNATYIAAGITNAGAVQVPNGFVFEYRIGSNYAPGPTLPGKTTPDYYIRQRAVCIVTNTQPVCSRASLVPNRVGQLNVVDTRVTNGPFLGTNLPAYHIKADAKETPFVAVDAAKQRIGTVIERPPPGRTAIAIIAVIVLLPVAGFLYFVTVRKKH